MVWVARTSGRGNSDRCSVQNGSAFCIELGKIPYLAKIISFVQFAQNRANQVSFASTGIAQRHRRGNVTTQARKNLNRCFLRELSESDREKLQILLQPGTGLC
jgi:hypothetical protein